MGTYNVRVIVRNAASITLALLVLAGVRAITASAATEACKNAQFRVGYAAGLPDCRAYELVTPAGSATPIAPLYLTSVEGVEYSLPEGNQQAQASLSGDRLAYGSEEANPESPGLIYLARRGSLGWSAENVIPPQSVEDGICIVGADIAGWSMDLSKAVLADGHDRDNSGHLLRCGRDEPELVPGEPRSGWGNLFVRDSETASYQLVDVTPSTVSPAEAYFDAASFDLSHVVFDEAAQLTANAPSGDELYVWSAGNVYLVTILPGGMPVQGELAGGLAGSLSHAVSADGSRIYFQADGSLFLRENGAQASSDECGQPSAPCTVEVDAVQGGSGVSGGGVFRWASVDGRRVFFTDESKLTADSSAEVGKPDLYEYDVEAPAGDRLKDLTAGFEGPSDVQGVSGASEDGSFVYFVADGVRSGAEESPEGTVAQAGHPNLYVRQLGEAGEETRLVATLDGASSDVCDWTPTCLTARVSPEGGFIAFDSVSSLTGYDSTPVDPMACVNTVEAHLPGSPCIEIYRYAWAGRELRCVSCNPTGAPPVGSTTIRKPTTMFSFTVKAMYADRNVSDGGQVFFDSPDALVPRASNDVRNVYEYENGTLYLISSGTSSEASYFYDASPDGANAFFLTEQPLLAQDTAAKYAVYDARVGGGFPTAPPAQLCGREGCQNPIAAPAFESPGSLSFVGPGNLPSTRSMHEALTRKQRLAHALRACRRLKKRHARIVCKRRALKRYRARRR
jgi:hypothetical protein